MPTSNGTGGGLWSAGSTWAGGVIPADGEAVTIAAGDTVTMDYDTSAWTGAGNVTITGAAVTPGTLRFAAGTNGYLKLRTGSKLLGTNATVNGRLLANSDGAWATDTALPQANTAVIDLQGTAYVDALYLDIKLIGAEPTNLYAEVYGTAYACADQTTGVAVATDVITFGSAPPADGTPVKVRSSGTLPTGLNTTDLYYVRAKSGNTCKLALQNADAQIVDIAATGTGALTMYDGHTSTSTKTLNVVQNVTADTPWAAGAAVVLCDIGPADVDAQRDTFASATSGTITITSANVDSAQYPLARLYLASRNVAIRQAAATAAQIVVDYGAGTHAGVYACEIRNTASLTAAYGHGISGGGATGLGHQITGGVLSGLGRGVSGGTGLRMSGGAIAGCSSGVYGGAGHTLSGGAITGCTNGVYQGAGHTLGGGAIAGCSSGVYYGTGHALSGGAISGCSSGVYGGAGHTLSGGAIAGCSYGVYSGTGHALSGGAISGCSSGVYSGTGHALSGGAISGCSSGVYGGAGHTLSGGTITGCTYGVGSGAGALRGATIGPGNTRDIYPSGGVWTGTGATLASTTQVAAYKYADVLSASPVESVQILDLGGVAEAIGAWTAGGYVKTETWVEGTHDPSAEISPNPTQIHALHAEDSHADTWVRIPFRAVGGQAVTVTCRGRLTGTAAWTERPTFAIVDPSKTWRGTGEVLDSEQQANDTGWHTYTLTYAPTYDRELALVVRAVGGNTSGTGTEMLYFDYEISTGGGGGTRAWGAIG